MALVLWRSPRPAPLCFHVYTAEHDKPSKAHPNEISVRRVYVKLFNRELRGRGGMIAHGTRAHTASRYFYSRGERDQGRCDVAIVRCQRAHCLFVRDVEVMRNKLRTSVFPENKRSDDGLRA